LNLVTLIRLGYSLEVSQSELNQMINQSTTPVQVELAIQAEWMVNETNNFLDSLDIRVQNYNQAWQILSKLELDSHHAQTLVKAKIVVSKNGWNWNEIVSDAIKNLSLNQDQVTCLTNYQNRLIEGEIKSEKILQASLNGLAAIQAKAV